ncbi:cytochrome P450 [Mycobacterium avium subsp. hominissuis]|nr:cytochrome P450 [Mycobacterium avium]ETA95546.1 cytochrome P450 [Mycobacterium avium 10-5581]APA74581.1 cytochrome P450 [Mycobacterium avium subsp. hominissuis]ATO61547.2 cytochrome P450 [Mycobacterium avium subsp. hominissuis]ATO66100.1 cytochrome P450 [Mycobacterium avium subsp. hominissuis]ATO70684.2 cytochrome P450 [Mycobacterium avium subsp. hominissuis]
MSQPELVFDPYSADFYARPHELFQRMRKEAPVYYNQQLDFYALTRYEDVSAAYRDFETYSSARGLDLAMVTSGEDPPKMILFMDPPAHGRMRSLLNKAFTARAIQSQRSMLSELVRRSLETVDPSRFDVVQDFSALFPVEAITTMAGVPAESRHQVRSWVEQTLGAQPGRVEADGAGMNAWLELAAYYYNLVEERRKQPKDDMISALIAARVREESGAESTLEDYEIALFALLLVGAGTETVTKLVASAVAVFAQHPDQWQMLLEDRRRIPGAVEELLRYDGPVLYNVRSTRREVTLRRVTIPAGKPVFLCTASANRDPDAFTDADTFDIGRDHSQAQHLGFGYGVHSCLGAALARMETAIALDHLLDFMPRYEVIWEDSRRVNSSNSTGWSHLPVRVLG